MMRAPWRWTPALVLMGLIFALSSLPDPSPPVRFAHSDKVLHAAAYAALAASLLIPGLPPLRAAGAAALYGATDEIHQRFVPGRDASLGDWAADLAGAAAAAAGAWAWRRRS